MAARNFMAPRIVSSIGRFLNDAMFEAHVFAKTGMRPWVEIKHFGQSDHR